MKTLLWLALLATAVAPAKGQGFEVQQLLLDWQKLTQEKQILSEMYSGYQILSRGYTTISDLSHGSFNLHKAFLDGLLSVNPIVREYSRVADIIRIQEQILGEYKTAWTLFQRDPHFSGAELGVIGNVYSGLFDRTVKNIAHLTDVLTDGLFRASDAERLGEIDGLYRDMLGSQVFVASFNNRTALLSLQRSADMQDYNSVRQLYGLNS